MRGVFPAGVLHAFGRSGFDPFDLYIGVSAGACNLASHLAGQNDRNFEIIERYSSTSRFISMTRFLSGGHLMDLDWLWDVTIRDSRIDLKTLFSKLCSFKKEYLVVATSMEHGGALYLSPDENTLEHFIKVSSALPVLYRGSLTIGAERAADGGVADSIPVREAYNRGAKRITVLRTRSADFEMKRSRLRFISQILFRKYPEFARALGRREVSYNDAVRFIQNPPSDVIVDEIAPPPGKGPGRATTNLKILRAAYRSGIEQGEAFIEAYNRGGTQ